ncbi:unnamed protein product [Gongylonema pulchrum]|uniref:SCP domain-containing protein n=1 Tax=Gongylonema pulchrum TaxID=637853 RepID=A0A183DV13_9BILA|nr:unnamed protein product [Gongylonema pulchrum]
MIVFHWLIGVFGAAVVQAQRSMVLTRDIVPQTMNARMDASGKTVYDCTDIMGKAMKFLHCQFVEACIGSERTGGALIKPGETLNKDGFWHKCTHYPKNQTAVYTEGKRHFEDQILWKLYQTFLKINEDGYKIIETACNVNDKQYHIGDLVRSAFFLMKCSEDGYKIIGCYYVGNNGKEVDMKPGTTAEANGQIHHCDDNDGNIQYYATGALP